METKIRYKDLSNWLKAGFIATCIIAGYSILAFLVGFIEGIIQQGI